MNINENRGKAASKRLARDITRTILEVLRQTLDSGKVVVGGLFAFLDGKVNVQLTLPDGRKLSFSNPIDVKNLWLDEVYVEFMTYGHPDIMDEVDNDGAAKRSQGSYSNDAVTSFLIIPIEEFDIGDKGGSGRHALEGLHTTVYRTLVHEFTHAQQEVTGYLGVDYDRSDAKQKKNAPGKEYYLSEAEVDAHVAEIKELAKRLTRMIRRDAGRYSRMVGRIDDTEIKGIAQNVEGLLGREDRYEMMFKIALELFISDEGIDPGVTPGIRQQYLKHFHRKYHNTNSKLTEAILVKLLQLVDI